MAKFNPKDFFARHRTLYLEIYEAAIDLGFAHDEAKQPDNVPYFCQLLAYYENGDDSATIRTHGIVYPKFRQVEFTGWNMATFEVDGTRNSDEFDLAEKQENAQGYAFLYEGDNLTENHAQIAADALDYIISRLTENNVTIEYPNGFVNLVVLKTTQASDVIEPSERFRK